VLLLGIVTATASWVFSRLGRDAPKRGASV